MNKKRTGKIIIFCVITMLMLSAYFVGANIVKATEIVGEQRRFNTAEEAAVEALEETLGKLKLEEPLFITYVAKKTFANAVFKNVEKNNKTQIN